MLGEAPGLLSPKWASVVDCAFGVGSGECNVARNVVGPGSPCALHCQLKQLVARPLHPRKQPLVLDHVLLFDDVARI